MTCIPESVFKMAGFESLILCISPNSSQMCTYFCKDLVTGYFLSLAKNSIRNRFSFQIDFTTHTLIRDPNSEDCLDLISVPSPC